MPSGSSLRFYWLFGFVLLLAAGLRFSAAYQWQARQPSPTSFAWGDSKTYWQIADNLAEQGDYSFGTPPKRIFRAPGYCGFLALQMIASRSLFSQPLSVLTARYVGAFLGTVAIALLALWARQVTGRDAVALLTALILSVYPGGIAMSIFVLSEALFMPVMILGLWTWSQALSARRWQDIFAWALIAGLFAGQAVLIRPSWLLFPPLAALALLVVYRNHKTFAANVVVGLFMVLAMVPWWMRNYQLTGQFVPTTLQVGASLYDGWNPRADGASDMSYGYEIENQVRAELQRQAIDQPWSPDELAIQQEMAANAALSEAARTWARQNPTRLAQLFLIKVGRTWRPWPVAEQSGSRATQWAVALSMLLIVGFALPQWRKAWADPTWLLIWLPVFYFTVLHGVFVGSVRYRQPAVFLLAPLAAMTVLQIWNSWICHRKDTDLKVP